MCPRTRSKNARRPGVADVIRAGIAFVQKRVRFHLFQWDVFNAILACRTGRLGARKCRCNHCRKEHLLPHSCRNRHCPICQGGNAHRWLEKQKEALLPIPYFHVVFTLPHELNPLIRSNQRQLYGLLFKAATGTLLEFGRNNLKAQLGITCVIHTWGQTLCEHYHVHCIVTGGGLALDGQEWIGCPRSKRGNRPYLFAVHALSQVFRAKYLQGLKALRAAGELKYLGQSQELQHPDAFAGLRERLRAKGWIVYCKRPFAGPSQVLAYLARYTHRIAIGDDRILRLDKEAGDVSFRYKDYHQNGKRRSMKLTLEAFMRRLSLHILPKGLQKIRHCGILSNRSRREKIETARKLLDAQPEQSQDTGDEELPLEEASAEQLHEAALPPCPFCGHAALVVIDFLTGPETMNATRGPPLLALLA